MITSASIPYISQVLKDPQKISEADAESIAALKESFPYFVPARYLDAAYRHKQAPFNESMMADMRLYTGNWLLYATFLQNAVGGEEVEMKLSSIKKDDKAATPKEEIVQEETIDTPIEVATEEPTVAPTPAHDDIDDGFDMGDTGFVTGQNKQTADIAPSMQTPTDAVDPRQNIKDRLRQEPDETLILPVYTEDYFMHQGVNVSNTIPDDFNAEPKEEEPQEKEKSLMVVMSFSEWLTFFKTKKQAEEEEEEGQKALRTMWQREKLAAALEEEDDEIPENVFEMAVNSISKEEGLISESLANIHIKQGRFDKAIEMYRKLSLRNPQKKAYFARKIEVLLKDKNS